MSSRKILRSLWIPVSSTACGIGVVHAKAKKEEVCDSNRTLVRACDLPLYADEKKCSHCTPTSTDPDICPDKSLLEETVTCCRKEMWFFMDQVRVVKGEVAEALGIALENANAGLEFLREEDNLVPRIGAIAVGGLSGFVFGLRKNIFKRLFYTSVGAGAIAALCYPREAKEYGDEALEQARKYTIIAYHFLNGGQQTSEKPKQ